LKSWRLNLSRELDVPAFVIMQDRTLLEIVQKMPHKSDELKEINGLESKKITKYGEDILKIING